MEGFGVLRAAQLAGIPALEVRAIANHIEGDRSRPLALRRRIQGDHRCHPTARCRVCTVRTLTFGYSPCPNDTFAFHALAHGLVDAPFRVRPVLLDIEELNRAHEGAFDLTKLSVGAFAAVGDRYRLLRSGAALGHGVGPLVVARNAISLADAVRGRMAIPGRETTAFRLLRLAAPALGDVIEMRYDRILQAVAGGAVDAGLIIHESRFTFAAHGLVQVADLGAWWEAETGLPVPLAGICARHDLDADTTRAPSRRFAHRSSVHLTTRRRDARYAGLNAQEMSRCVCDAHIALYVNALSLDVGDSGMRAITRLVRGATTDAWPNAPDDPPATCRCRRPRSFAHGQHQWSAWFAELRFIHPAAGRGAIPFRGRTISRRRTRNDTPSDCSRFVAALQRDAHSVSLTWGDRTGRHRRGVDAADRAIPRRNGRDPCDTDARGFATEEARDRHATGWPLVLAHQGGGAAVREDPSRWPDPALTDNRAALPRNRSIPVRQWSPA
ncbi:MAG: hypothetical protein IPF98_08315 [Gemmatimonadetes bacterium]|nr:hypothetical protein [Gemmatimonadota bacterium]